MFTFRQKGDLSKTTNFLKRAKELSLDVILDRYGQMGVDALSSATPVDSGTTASSWYYDIERGDENIKINYNNSNINDGVPIAIILQYGHGLHNGGWVEGRDYINPAIQPIFDEIVDRAWKEVTRL